jgi:glycosyltransferase involved in cell wall biosynthesis
MPARAVTVWIVNPYGTLPSEGWRDYRSAMLARALAERGHQVRWWISDIEHRSKQRRVEGIVDPLLPPKVVVEVVRTRAYRRNISLGRIFYERSFASGFAATAQQLSAPDLIVLADPSLFFGGPVVEYARRRNIPFVLDVLDLWPELFHILLPEKVRGLGRTIFAPLYRRRDCLVAQAAAVVAVTGDYLAETTRRTMPQVAEVVYLGVDRAAFTAPGREREPDAPLEVIYAGTLGDAYDMQVVLSVIGRVAMADLPVRFTIAGDGPWREQTGALAKRFPRHVRFLGSIPAHLLPEHYFQSHVGLASYAPGSTVSMPVKLFDYMAAGLATIGSMGGEAGTLLRQGAGRPYVAGSVDDLFDVLTFYMKNPAALGEARRFALEASGQFDQVTQHRRFATLIEKLLGEGGSRC